MSKVKTQDEAGDKAAATQTADERKPAVRKDYGPALASRAPAAPSYAAPAERATASRALQRSLGNARAMRMMSDAHEGATAARAEDERKLSPSGGPKAARVQRLAVSHPEDASEKEAESVARSVVAGRNAPPITPLSRGETQALAHRQEKEEKAHKEEKEKPAHTEEKEKKSVGEMPPAARLAQRREKEDEKQAHPKDEEKKARGNEDDEQPHAAMRLEATPGERTNAGAAEDAIARKGAGSPVNPSLRRALEPRMGADLSAARVHQDSAANDAASAINARAFAHGSDIYLARGESENDTRLMAHELTHVVQQTGGSARQASRAPQPAPAQKPDDSLKKKGPAVPGAPAASGDAAPGFLDLKGMPNFDPPAAIDQFLDDHKEASVEMRFGELAKGQVKVSKSGKGGKESYSVKKQPIRLSHPLFERIAEVLPGLEPCLVVQVEGKTISGSVGLAISGQLPKDALSEYIEKGPELLGLAGFSFPSLPKLTNKLEAGQLHLGLSGVPFRLGSAFGGTLTFEVIDQRVTFAGNADIAVKGLAKGTLDLKRDAAGLITGKITLALELPKNFTGGLDISWDGRAVAGEGKVGYTGEKLSGEVILRLTERGEAEQLEREKKAPPDAAAKPGGTKAPAKESKDKDKGKKIDYVVFGEGDLTFAFNEWLNGTAHVIVDQKGFVTIIGKITPQKEFELFEQKDFIKPLFKFEARASYGIPVVGNIFIFANVGMDAFAKLGPAKFYNIVVEGTYSTDPDKNKDFSIKGSINISAAAGLRLRAEAGAGLEILGHDIKAGAGLSGIAGIKAYAEATPTIGYREKGAPGEDKKGEFFIRGDLEIAAQPFLGLSGDLFVEIDAPWWSPVPDKKWTWPLFNKEYPIGGSFGMLASVDYVFGSKQWPAIEFKPVDFSADKFMTDLYTDKVKSKSAEEGDKKGDWKEKNTKDAEIPTGGGEGDAKQGTLGTQGDAKNKVESGGGKKGGKKEVDDNATTADGKKVEEYKKKAAKEGKKDPIKDLKTGATTEKKPDDEKSKETQSPEKKWERGANVVSQALAYAEKEGIELKELNQILKSIRKQKQYGFTDLYADAAEDQFVVMGSMSAAKPVTKVKSKGGAKTLKRPKEIEGKATPNLDQVNDIEEAKSVPISERAMIRYVKAWKDGPKDKTVVEYVEDRAAKKLGRHAERPGIEAYNAETGAGVVKNTKVFEILRRRGTGYSVERSVIPDFYKEGVVVGDVKRTKDLSLDPQMKDDILIAEANVEGNYVRMRGADELLTKGCRFDLVVRGPADDLPDPEGTHVSKPLKDEVRRTKGDIYRLL